MKADIAIITIREDEFGAVFDRLEKHQSKTWKGASRRTYATFSVPTSDGKICAVALARSAEQGPGIAQQVAADMMQDLDPQLLLVVGIAGGLPHNEFTLGDVIISSRIHDFTLNAVDQGVVTFNVMGGVHPLVSDITASLPMYRRSLLAGWNERASIGLERPPFDLTWVESHMYGDATWQNDVLTSLRTQFGESASRAQLPLFKIGNIASSNSLLKDTEIPTTWLKDARSILAVEMESAGALRAAQQMAKQYPVMAIRGISDIIGLKRDGRWTSYACQTAGAFTYAFIKAGIIEPQESSSPTISTSSTPSSPAISTTSTSSNPTVPPTSTSSTPVVQLQSSNSTSTNSTDEKKPAPLDLFISYSEDDEKFEKELETHLVMLRREGTIRPWHSQQTQAGLETEKNIDSHIDQSQIILLLISPSFLASDYLYEQEMARAMKRHAEGAARVVPIIIRSANIGETSFSKLQALPRSHQPVDKASNRDEVWSKIAQEIRDICKSLRNSQNQS